MDTVKIIDTQQKFANSVYQDFMSKRFGITTCSSGDMDATHIKKQLCDWQSSDIKVPEILSITSEIFIPSSPYQPCTDTNAPEWCTDCSYVENPDLDKLIEELNDQLEKLIAEKENIEAELVVRQEELTTLESEISSIESQIASLEASIALLQSEIADLLNQLQALQAEFADLDEQYNANCVPTGPEPFCSNLAQQLNDIKDQIDALEETIAAKQTELNDQQQQLADLLLVLEEKEAEKNTLENFIEDLQAELGELIEEIENLSNEIKALEAQYCLDDGECVTFEVIDNNGSPVKDFELYIDRLGTILTNSLGQYIHTFTNASVDTEHSLQLCYCFITILSNPLNEN